MSISFDVVVPVFSDGAQILKLIKNILNQSVKPERIILVTGKAGRVDEEALASVQGVSVIVKHTSSDFTGTVYNAGLKSVRSEAVLMLDERAVPGKKDSVEKLLVSLEQDEKRAAVFGRLIPGSHADALSEAVQRSRYKKEASEYRADNLYRWGYCGMLYDNACALLKVSAVSETGFYEPECPGRCEMILNASLIYAGYALAYEPEAAFIMSRKIGILQGFHESFRTGVLKNRYAEDIGLTVQMILREEKKVWVINNMPMDVIYEEEGKKAAAYLKKKKRFFTLICLRLLIISEKLGDLLGTRYHRLPLKLVKRFSAVSAYWE